MSNLKETLQSEGGREILAYLESEADLLSRIFTVDDTPDDRETAIALKANKKAYEIVNGICERLKSAMEKGDLPKRKELYGM